MYLIFLSLITILIVFYLFLVLYLKCKMPFWSKQPVFHLYNLLYWLSGPPGLINPSPPLVNKYVDLFNIKTFSLEDLNNIDIICEFIKTNYIYSAVGTNAVGTNAVGTNAVGTSAVGTSAVGTSAVGTIYSPTKNNLIEYLQHSNHQGYFTVYQESKMFLTPEKEHSTNDIIAVISARPLYVRLNKKSLFGSKKTMFTTYYVDNLCVQPAYRKKNIAATMIQTHYYNLRQQNKQINTCLFKREGELNAIVPLVAFKTYCISLGKGNPVSLGKGNPVSLGKGNPVSLGKGNPILPIYISLIEIGSSQLHLLIDFIKSQMGKFSCVILPDVSNITNLIKTENLRIYCLIDKELNSIIACYVFRLIALTYDGEKAVECIATIADCSQEIFQQGFLAACNTLQAKDNTNLVLLEETAHAHLLLSIPNLSIKFTSPTAFFFYNYACYSIKAKECLIIY